LSVGHKEEWTALCRELKALVDSFNEGPHSGGRATIEAEPDPEYAAEFRVGRSLDPEAGTPSVWVALEFDLGTGEGKWTFGTASLPPPRGAGVQQFSGRFRVGDGQAERLLQELLRRY
jgi:hypothetical protein